MSDKIRFDLSAHPLPKNAQGKSFFDKSPGYTRLRRAFRQLVEDMQQHAALRTRVAVEIRLEPLDRDTFTAAIEHGLKAAGASQKIIADQAMEMLFRSSRGVLRVASKTLRTAIRMAADRGQTFLDEAIVQAALDELGVGIPT